MAVLDSAKYLVF